MVMGTNNSDIKILIPFEQNERIIFKMAKRERPPFCLNHCLGVFIFYLSFIILHKLLKKDYTYMRIDSSFTPYRII